MEEAELVEGRRGAALQLSERACVCVSVYVYMYGCVCHMLVFMFMYVYKMCTFFSVSR